MRTRSLPLGVLFAFVWPLLAAAVEPPADLLVGTYTSKGKSKGIYVFRFNPGDGSLEPLSVATGVTDPSWVLVSPDARFVYAVNELHGGGGGKVSAFRFDAKAGTLALINEAPSGGDDPCYLSLSGDGQALFVANYSSGSLAALPVGEDGGVGARPAQVLAHEGHGPNAERQKSAHVHCVLPAPDGRVILATDLGEDRVYAYRYAAAKAGDPVLEPADPAFVAEPPGSGPRHLAFSADGRFVYAIHEMGETVTVNRVEGGHLTAVQTVTVAAEPWPGDTGAAALHLSPDGRFLYASNRANANDVLIYAVNAADGTLTPAGRQDAGGSKPRDFAIDPSGRYLLVANQDSDNVVVFRRDADTGALAPTGKTYEVGSPVCLQFAEEGK